MNTLFPLGFPLPTALYLTLYVATLVIHVLLMNYVLAGIVYVTGRALQRATWSAARRSAQPPTALAALLRDWLPFALGAAITAGVAPLLFVQLLYKLNFYSANLLLFHRWMALLPALIVGFYLLYVLKSRQVGSGPRWAAPLVGLGAFLCFGYTAWAWTENHLLSLNSGIWPSFYASRSMWYHDALLWPRLGMWALGALPGMALIAGWQLRRSGQCARELAVLALVGLLLAGGCACWHHQMLPEATQSTIAGPLAQPWLIAALLGAGVQAVGWLLVFVRARPAADSPQATAWPCMVALTLGWIMMTLGMTVVREAIRLSAIDITQLYDQHAKLAQAGGMVWFLLFLVLNAAAVAWCVVLVRKERLPSAARAT